MKADVLVYARTPCGVALSSASQQSTYFESENRLMKRRDFLKAAGAACGSTMLPAVGANTLSAQLPESASAVAGQRPNIVFILVDELRYPTFFPRGIKDPESFLKTFMPNLYSLWQSGVKFDNYFTAANACTPARGTIITGLYSQQSWLLTTILSSPNPTPIQQKLPVLNPAFPTYGRLLQNMGYKTPYAGKWHVALPQADMGGLTDYGFDYRMYPDPTGSNLQGSYGNASEGFHNDAQTADAALDFLRKVKRGDDPFCLTVGFVNPHDREFFPSGTEFKRIYEVFADKKINPNNLLQGRVYTDVDDTNQSTNPTVQWSQDQLKNPRHYGYADLPPNWETSQDWIDQKKPSTQAFIKEFQQNIWGGITENPDQTDFTIVPYSATKTKNGVLKAPFHYWRRGMDCYTDVMQLVDVQIGRVLDQVKSLPKSVAENTIVIFASDHGEYSGAHGMPQGKMATVYEEAWRIPLIVSDPSGRFTGDISSIRHGLASSVDLMPMLVTLGNNGSTAWMSNELKKIYGGRHDLLSMLKSNSAPGRDYVLLATDEIAPRYYNSLDAPTHVLGFRTSDYKFGVSADWKVATSDIKVNSAEYEFYDYSTERGRLELDNSLSDPRAQQTMKMLLNDIIPNELQKPLPPSLRVQQLASKAAHLVYRQLVESKPLWQPGELAELLGYGGPF